MTILHVAYNTWPDLTGGAMRTRYLAETQARLGVRAVVLSSPFQPPAEASRARGVECCNDIPYYRCYNGADPARFMAAGKPWWERAARLRSLAGFARRIREVARMERADVIHAHSLFFCGLAAAWAGRSMRTPVIYEVRSLIDEGMDGASPLVRGAYRTLEGLACRLADHVTVLSEGLRGELIRRGVPEWKITVAGNGVDLRAHQPAGERASGDFVLGYIGTLARYEGLDLLLDAAARLAPAHPQLRVLLAGDGPARGELEQQVDQLGLRRVVRFLGRVPHEEVACCYDAADLFVLPRRPSRITDLVTPLKPLEIMAHGAPLLAGDCGGHRELIVEGVNGVLFRRFDAAALAAKIEQLMANPAGLAELGRRAREWVAGHRGWESQCAPVVALYERLARRRVALVAPAPGDTVTGGVENGVAMILRSGLARRHDIRLWDRNRYRHPRRPRAARLVFQLLDFARFAAWLAATRPHVVHIKSSCGANFVESAIYAAIGRALGRRVLLQLHSGDFERWTRERGAAGRWGVRLALRLPSGILALSEYWRDALGRLAPGRPIEVVPNGVEMPEARPRLDAAPDGLRVLTIGTLSHHKGHLDLLAAAARLRQHPIRFLLAGPDQASGRGEGAEVRRRAAEMGLNGQVEFLGPVGDERKRELLASSDVFALPSRAEGMPNVVLEAMAAGLPVLATPVGAIPEMLAEANSFIAPGDSDGLARKLLDLLEDPARREAMGRANRARVEAHYSFARVEKILDELYQRRCL